jgi:hypothetical protein
MTTIEEESGMDIAWLIAGAAFFGVSAGLVQLINSLTAGE